MAGVVFSRVSADGEEGFPGELLIEAGYFITEWSDLVFTWSAKFCGANKNNTPTPINLTNHAYWNLSGDFQQPTIGDHHLKLKCSNYLPLDASQIPTKEVAPVDDTVFDFRTGSQIAEKERLTGAIDGGGKPGIDHPFIVDGEQFKDKLNYAAELKSSTRRMIVRTT